ncbi:MAG: phosphoglucosamine mutase [Deinococcales bacterium]
MTQRRYFGTDGVRGVAGEPPMTAAFAFRLGVAAAEGLRRRGTERPRVVIGMDTRRSGPMLAHAVSAGLASRGASVTWLGVIPTPGVSFLARKLGSDAGVVVSASHNPFGDNGLKLFNHNGEKLSDALEEEIEALLDVSPDDLPPVTGSAVGSAARYRLADGHYVQHLLSNAPYLDGLRVGLDCANGASSLIAPKVFQKIGARLDVINNKPDGENINVGCGSTTPGAIQARVVQHELDVGVTFDGDADRALLVDRRGRLVSGDHILAICALTAGDDEVVATVMSNLGVERYLAEHGVRMHRVQVGDRYVYEALTQRGLRLGGEQSGHVLFLDKSPTGDGILTALQLLAAVRKSGRPLTAWMDEITVFPQCLLNVRVPLEAKAGILQQASVRRAVDAARVRLGDDGRINLRPSGTEPLVRVMVEAEDESLVGDVAKEVAAAVEAAVS